MLCPHHSELQSRAGAPGSLQRLQQTTLPASRAQCQPQPHPTKSQLLHAHLLTRHIAGYAEAQPAKRARRSVHVLLSSDSEAEQEPASPEASASGSDFVEEGVVGVPSESEADDSEEDNDDDDSLSSMDEDLAEDKPAKKSRPKPASSAKVDSRTVKDQGMF